MALTLFANLITFMVKPTGGVRLVGIIPAFPSQNEQARVKIAQIRALWYSRPSFWGALQNCQYVQRRLSGRSARFSCPDCWSFFLCFAPLAFSRELEPGLGARRCQASGPCICGQSPPPATGLESEVWHSTLQKELFSLSLSLSVTQSSCATLNDFDADFVPLPALCWPR